MVANSQQYLFMSLKVSLEDRGKYFSLCLHCLRIKNFQLMYSEGRDIQLLLISYDKFYK